MDIIYGVGSIDPGKVYIARKSGLLIMDKALYIIVWSQGK